MKKLAMALPILTLLASSANADALGFGVGGGVFYANPSGNAQYIGAEFDIENAGVGKSANGYGWAYLEHFVPILPNLRIDVSQFTSKGSGAANFQFGGTTFSGDVHHNLKANQTDLIGYYVLPIPLVDVRLGLSASYFDLALKFEKSGIEETAKGDTFLPMAYGGFRFEIPATDLALEADAKYVKYQKSHIAYYRAKVDYTFDFVVKAAIEAGYKKQEIVVKDLSGFDGELDVAIDGFFAGISARF